MTVSKGMVDGTVFIWTVRLISAFPGNTDTFRVVSFLV